MPIGIYKRTKPSWAKGLKRPECSGNKNGKWNGGRSLTREGYVLVLNTSHPNAIINHRYVLEHRIVMEKTIGRLLKKNEAVHHVNGNPADNRTKNLILFRSNGVHTNFHKGFAMKKNDIAFDGRNYE